MARRTKPPPGTFTVTGIPGDALYPRRRAVTWRDGTLRGDAALIAVATEQATALHGHPVGPHEGPVTTREHLASPLSALMILADLFIPGTVELSGDVPQRPPIPKGAIG